MILIVDDKRENLLSLQSLLFSQGYPVETASDGEEALKKVLQKTYGLIILDVQMPGMDGFEVAEMLTGYSKTRDVPIIFLSALNVDKKYITKGYRSGGIDYITKPIDPDILLLKVDTLYRLYEQKRQLNEMQIRLQQEVEFRKRAQKESQDHAQQLRAILESIPQIAFSCTRDGEIEFYNTHWQTYTGDAEYPGVHPEETDFPTLLKEMINQTSVFEKEVRLTKPTEYSYRYFLLRAAPTYKDGEIHSWTATFTDIEEQKQSSRRKDEFLSVASHELKTPITSIKGYLQLLERTLASDCPGRLYAERSLVQIHKLDNLIADLLDISRIESGRMKLQKTTFPLKDLVKRVVDQMQHVSPDYVFNIEGDTDAILFGDEMRLEQVLLNFLSNAVKYSPHVKEVVVSITTPGPGKVKVAVVDRGIGIGKEDQRLVFEKFYRSEDSIRNFQGLGLGLYICADLLQRHEGSYGVTSEPGKGSVFYFTLPTHNTSQQTHSTKVFNGQL